MGRGVSIGRIANGGGEIGCVDGFSFPGGWGMFCRLATACWKPAASKRRQISGELVQEGGTTKGFPMRYFSNAKIASSKE